MRPVGLAGNRELYLLTMRSAGGVIHKNGKKYMIKYYLSVILGVDVSSCHAVGKSELAQSV
ncbi:hypothetical protein FRUB_05757 [Fimbriiglobus ruber]|uniref:Uncharacterized protein n=1 Tax=Fimbriiglobus ruber TaxID=1908690 RepID=A0A225DUP4_9BACT|nr:hypothetical protein FRUB_05757 [Fimbriiglobus ruber]